MVNITYRVDDKSKSISQYLGMDSKKISQSTKDLNEFLLKLNDQSSFNTGLMPQGVRMVTQHDSYLQVVVELPPGINRNIWGQSEHDPEAEHFMLAQPWRIVIMDILNGQLLGCRVFYSMTHIYDLDMPLYNTNLSNINCFGYRGNGVGWVCLYKKSNFIPLSMQDKITNLIDRCSGSEAFNYGNMSETDGIKLYRQWDDPTKPDFTWDVALWEKKSDEEGFEWVLDEDLWIPVKVKSEDAQGENMLVITRTEEPEEEEYISSNYKYFHKHHDDAVQLTLRMAIDGKYAPYYDMPQVQAPTSIYRKNQEINLDIFNKAFKKTEKTVQTKAEAVKKEIGSSELAISKASAILQKLEAAQTS